MSCIYRNAIRVPGKLATAPMPFVLYKRPRSFDDLTF